MNKKKILSCVLACAMVASMSVNGFAVENNANFSEYQAETEQLNDFSKLETIHYISNGIDTTIKSYIENGINVKTVVIENGKEQVFLTSPEVIQQHNSMLISYSAPGASTLGMSDYWYVGESTGRDGWRGLSAAIIAASLASLSGLPSSTILTFAGYIWAAASETNTSVSYVCQKYYAEETFGAGNPPIFYTKCIFDTFDDRGDLLVGNQVKIMKSDNTWFSLNQR